MSPAELDFDVGLSELELVLALVDWSCKEHGLWSIKLELGSGNNSKWSYIWLVVKR